MDTAQNSQLADEQPGSLGKWLAGGCAILFLLAFIVPGIGSAIYSLVQWREVLVLSQSGVVTQASVFDRSQTESDDGTTYYLHYRFVADDHVYEDKDDVSQSAFYDSPLDGKVTIRYGRTDPTISQIGSETSLAAAIAVTIFAVIWNGFLVLIFVGARSARAQESDGS
jgi:hypothetical protein